MDFSNFHFLIRQTKNPKVVSGIQLNQIMLNLTRIIHHKLEKNPYQWAMVDGLFSASDASEIAATYPCDHYKPINGYDGEKGYQYHVRSLIHMDAGQATYPEKLSAAWRQYAADLLSPAYRSALSGLVGINLMNAPMEVNIFHFGPNAWMGPHLDLKDKIVTHVFYFNERWDASDGGCLRILRSKNETDVFSEIPPVVGNSSVLVRSEKSWHAVSRVTANNITSRRSVTVTFYHPASPSSMWPVGDTTPLADFKVSDRR